MSGIHITHLFGDYTNKLASRRLADAAAAAKEKAVLAKNPNTPAFNAFATGTAKIAADEAAKFKHTLLGSAGELAAGAFTVAAISLAAYYIYKRFFSAAAKACKDKAGADRTECVRKFQVDAAEATIQRLGASKSKCPMGDDGERCRINVDKEINKWRLKLAKIKGLRP